MAQIFDTYARIENLKFFFPNLEAYYPNSWGRIRNQKWWYNWENKLKHPIRGGDSSFQYISYPAIRRHQ